MGGTNLSKLANIKEKVNQSYTRKLKYGRILVFIIALTCGPKIFELLIRDSPDAYLKK